VRGAFFNDFNSFSFLSELNA